MLDFTLNTFTKKNRIIKRFLQQVLNKLYKIQQHTLNNSLIMNLCF